MARAARAYRARDKASARYPTSESVAIAATEILLSENAKVLRAYESDLVLAGTEPIYLAFGIASRFNTSTKLRQLYQIAMDQRSSPTRIMLVAPSRPMIELGFKNVDWVSIRNFREWLRKWRNYKPKKKDYSKLLPQNESPKAAVKTIRSNVNRIVIATASLSLFIDARLEALRLARPNSPEAIAEIERSISDYKLLHARVAELEAEVRKLKEGRIKEPEARSAAKAFKASVEHWWSKSHGKVLDKSADVGIVLSAVGILSLMGVAPNYATLAVTALVGGKSVVGALRGTVKGAG